MKNTYTYYMYISSYIEKKINYIFYPNKKNEIIKITQHTINND